MSGFVLHCSTQNVACGHKIITGEVFELYYFNPWEKIVPIEKETAMAWKTPKIVEVSVGMEINMYACAARK